MTAKPVFPDNRTSIQDKSVIYARRDSPDSSESLRLLQIPGLNTNMGTVWQLPLMKPYNNSYGWICYITEGRASKVIAVLDFALYDDAVNE